jgi:hypothetical protein
MHKRHEQGINAPTVKRLVYLMIVLGIGCLGVYFYHSSQAASSAVVREPESGATSNGVSRLSDATASGGMAVKFSSLSAADFTWQSHYDVTKLIPDSGWTVQQSPKNPWTVDGPYLNRITTVTDAANIMGSAPFKPANAMRVDLLPGDVQTVQTNGNVRHASEVYGLYTTSGSHTPAENWPLGVEREAWFHFSFGLDPSFVASTYSTDWMDFMQLKGQWGGSPPLALEAKLNRLQIGSSVGPRIDIGTLPIGHWTDLIIGVYLSDDPAKGWIHIERDGQVLVTKQIHATMGQDKSINGTAANPVPDPVYLKQGIYRTGEHQIEAIAWFGPTKVGRTKAAVQ